MIGKLLASVQKGYDVMGNLSTSEFFKVIKYFIATQIGQIFHHCSLLFLACQAIGDMMFQSTKLLGCEPFRKAQDAACVCVSDDEIDSDERDEL